MLDQRNEFDRRLTLGVRRCDGEDSPNERVTPSPLPGDARSHPTAGHLNLPRRPDPSVPSVQIDGFDELQPIGRGGFSYVFSARQRDFNRRVALKVLSFGLADERERRSFERECRAMGLVSQHPHIVTVFNAAFTTTKQPCIVMELYSGGTYGERQKREGQLPVAVVLDVGVKIAGALQTAHDRGLLHRDIKPNNLFISEFGEPALGDFGISTLDDERSISGGGGLTVHYAPPEVLEGSPATPLSDVYSLAATLYTLLEGTRPFAPAPGARQSVGELARRIMLEEPPRARRPDVSRSLADVLAGAMAKRPGDRPASAGALGQELQRVQGELGLSVTPLPLATPPLSPEPPATVVTSGPPPAVVARRRRGARQDRHRRAPAGAVRGPDRQPRHPLDAAHRHRHRGRRGVPAGRGHLAARVRPQQRRRHQSTTVRPPATQILEVRPPAPTGVAVTPGTAAASGRRVVGGGRRRVAGHPVPGAAGDGRAGRPATAALTATYDLPEQVTATPCFHVVAITPDGRISAQSELACG